MPYIAPLKRKLRLAANTGSASMPVDSKCRIGHSLDDQDDIFKKMMTPWCRHRPVRPPDLGFPPASDRRGHEEGHEHAFKKETATASVAVLRLASAKPGFRAGRTPCPQDCPKKDWRWRAEMIATAVRHYRRVERNTGVGEEHHPPPAPPQPPKPRPPPPAPPRCQPVVTAIGNRRYHRACQQLRPETLALPKLIWAQAG
jgi:hypothetical protein